MHKATPLGLLALLILPALCLQACQQAKPEPTPKYQGSDYKYYSPGAQGYGSPQDPKSK